MATIGSAKATLVNKINSLTSSATAKDTIFLAKALKENSSLNNFVWQGNWAATTEYSIDDVVTSGGNTYICKVAHTSGASFALGSNWDMMTSAGTDGTDGTTVGTGTAGQVLKTNAAGNGIEWGTGGGAWSEKSSGSFTTSSAIEFTGITKTTRIELNITASTGASGPRFRSSSDGGSTYDSTSGDYLSSGIATRSGSGAANIMSETAEDGMRIINYAIGHTQVYVNQGSVAHFMIDIYNPEDTSKTLFLFNSIIGLDTSGNLSWGSASGMRNTSAIVNAVQFYGTGSKAFTGTYKIWELN